MTENMNDEIEILYNSKLSDFYKAIENLDDCVTDKTFGPFIPYAFEEYFAAKRKIMIVGQQTMGWVPLKDAIKNNYYYKNFIELKEGSTKDFENGKGYYSSPFWRFATEINQSLNGSSSSRLAFIWNNLFKIEEDNYYPDSKNLYELTMKYFNILNEEIDIFKPEIVLMLTGPNYDWYFEKLWNEKYENIQKTAISTEIEIRRLAEFGNL